jgi:hypothetical protein
MAMNRLGPDSVIKDEDIWAKGWWESWGAMAKLPELKASSDVAWGAWVRFGAMYQPQSLRYFVSLSITNQATCQIIARVLTNKELTLTKWPGITIDIDSDEGKALIGKYKISSSARPMLITRHSDSQRPRHLLYADAAQSRTWKSIHHKDPRLPMRARRKRQEPVTMSDFRNCPGRRNNGCLQATSVPTCTTEAG